ncbi:MAG: HAD family hydrolase [Clostridiaceae bacterium]
MIKLIVTDMDGTLLNSEGKLPNDFYKTVRKVLDKGIIFAAASGRPYTTLKSNFHHIKDEMLFISDNGGYVMHKGRELYSTVMCKDKYEGLVKAARNISGVNIVLCGKTRAYIENDEDTFFMKEVNKYYPNYKKVKDLLNVHEDILKISLSDKLGAAGNSNSILTPVYGEDFKMTVSGEVWLDAGNKGINKGNSLRSVQKLFGITKEETMVFGDYYNDLEMLKEAYHSYAMENAPDEVKFYSRFIAKSNDEEGVLEVIKEKVLKNA